MKDQTFKCQDCGQQFAWTADEQAYYAKKNLAQPKHCLICRGKYVAKQRDLDKYKKPTK